MKSTLTCVKKRANISVIKYRCSFFSFAFFILIVSNSIAQNTITLAQAISKGISNKQDMKANNLNGEISKLQTKALQRKYLPQLNATYNYLYNPILQTSILPIGVFNPTYPIDATKNIQFGTKWSQSAGLTATIPILDLSISHNIRTAKQQEKITSATQEQEEYDLAYSIAQTYIDIYIQETKITSAIADTVITYENYIFFKNRYEEKQLLKTELNKSKVNHNNALQIVKNETITLLENKSKLLYLMGETNFEAINFELDVNFDQMFYLNNTSGIAANGHFPDIKLIEMQQEMLNFNGKAEKLKRTPTLGFKGFLGANQYSNEFNPTATNTWFGLSYLGIEVKLPILTGESNYNKFEQIRLQKNQLQLKLKDAALEHQQEMYSAKIKLENSKKQLSVQEENIELLKESLYIIQQRMLQGQETLSTLNLEEANLKVAKSNYDTIKKQSAMIWLNYLKATGQLSILWK